MSQPAYREADVEHTSPSLELIDPEPVRARHQTRDMLAQSPLEPEAQEDLVLAVSEVVTNAVQHGQPPVQVKGWLCDGEAVVTVTDCGEGPDDPNQGYEPLVRSPGAGGFGLWLARQLCTEVTTGVHDGTFTVRLVARVH